MSQDLLKYQIVALIEADVPPAEIANQLDTTIARVYRAKAEYEKAVLDGKLDEVFNMELLAAEQLRSGQVTGVAALDAEVDAATKNTAVAVGNLTKLDDATAQTATLVNRKINLLLNSITSIDDVEELQILTNTLAKLRESFFSKNVTQVNIQNNLGESSNATYTEWLSDKPANN